MDTLIKPIITEKMTQLGEKVGHYGFIVDKEANKRQIKKAVEEMYDVNVSSVNTIIVGGKLKSRFTKGGVIMGKTKTYKKAIVKLAEGDTIDFYSNI